MLKKPEECCCEELNPGDLPCGPCKDYNEADINNRLGFCGCGMPEAALNLIHEICKYIDYPRYEGPFKDEGWDEHFKNREEALKKLIIDNYDGVIYTLFYLLDDKGITTHGGSVPGWIADKEFYQQLKSYMNLLKN